ncbi:MAG: small, acid-soluble spore protein, alpha/beta type [Lachnospiraceae bacterium]|nr:small, acid-soluble spore protein, alpha/beta type [Lachnospiraceae bacterium]
MGKVNQQQKLEKEREKVANWRELPDEERLKYEIADELGLLAQVEKHGWRGLSAQETGRIGGLMTKRKKLLN